MLNKGKALGMESATENTQLLKSNGEMVCVRDYRTYSNVSGNVNPVWSEIKCCHSLGQSLESPL